MDHLMAVTSGKHNLGGRVGPSWARGIEKAIETSGSIDVTLTRVRVLHSRVAIFLSTTTVQVI